MAEKTVILINRYGMGDAEPELQIKLITVYLQMLVDGDWKPAALCFYGSGVKLATAASPVLSQLTALEQQGVTLILCSTCAGYYGIRDDIRVGIVGGMHDIMEAQERADKVITL